MLNSILNAVYSAAVLERGLLHHSYIDDPHRSSDHKEPPCEEHIPLQSVGGSLRPPTVTESEFIAANACNLYFQNLVEFGV